MAKFTYNWLKYLQIHDEIDIYHEQEKTWYIGSITKLSQIWFGRGLSLCITFNDLSPYEETIVVDLHDDDDDITHKLSPMYTHTPYYCEECESITHIEYCALCNTACCTECYKLCCVSVGDVIEVNLGSNIITSKYIRTHYIGLAKILFIGKTQLNNFTFGIELFTKKIDRHFINGYEINNGSINGKKYFDCSKTKTGYGTFIWAKDHFACIRPLWSTKQTEKILQLNPNNLNAQKLFINACKYGIIEVVKYLSDNKKTKHYFGKNNKAFNEALINNHYEVVEFLFDNCVSDKFFSKHNSKKFLKQADIHMLNLLRNKGKWNENDLPKDKRLEKFEFPVSQRLMYLVSGYISNNYSKYFPTSLINLISNFSHKNRLVKFNVCAPEYTHILKNYGHDIVIKDSYFKNGEKIIVACSTGLLRSEKQKVYQWKIQPMQQQHANAIGVISTLELCENTEKWIDEIDAAKTYRYKTYTVSCLWNGNGIIPGASCFKKWKAYDIVTIILDCKKEWIEYFINDECVMSHALYGDIWYPFIGIQTSNAEFRII